ncbi:pyridoxal-dependent decarboxylase family protein, putative [Acidisarcina polymorpha]|uniref:Pyridoxal-dependent decarboxylase family protein, putative n=1 Tax=Acidisarcina polymorpha TaxID=2211140 RepID=A0A2Z5FZ67_9BACT|nr:aminotransferase class I/II-fold pyridoxal phosphate-dependent enzyme [Acidisarcina polymorpha]AXC11787.1 pyridoxal-dependent decarboxylase family protein, putative [Acidisarcina polymorpha]
MPDDPFLSLVNEALPRLQGQFATLPLTGANPEGLDAMQAVLADVAVRMGDNYPYFHPLYAGQMMKPPHPIARAAYAMGMWLNPNNHSLDGGRASSRFEVEAVAEIASMFGWTGHLGHLTGGGTVANLEALWVAGKLRPGKRVVASAQAHYTHSRISAVLGLEFSAVGVDGRGRMDAEALEHQLRSQEIGTVVVTLGTTGIGAVDPLDQILKLREKYDFRIHVDAAYGGYFKLLTGLPAGGLSGGATRAFDCIGEADSIVVDPHKHGLQPYGCGCVLFHDPGVGHFYKHDSPYTYFSSAELHLGEITLECSRPGAAAVALWATQRLLPLAAGGEFAESLGRCRQAALQLYDRLRSDTRFVVAFEPELDILVWGVKAASVEEASRRAQSIFDEAARRDLHLALVQLPLNLFPSDSWPDASPGGTMTCLRSVLMKPEHLDWVDRIWGILSEAAKDALV